MTLTGSISKNLKTFSHVDHSVSYVILQERRKPSGTTKRCFNRGPGTFFQEFDSWSIYTLVSVVLRTVLLRTELPRKSVWDTVKLLLYIDSWTRTRNEADLLQALSDHWTALCLPVWLGIRDCVLWSGIQRTVRTAILAAMFVASRFVPRWYSQPLHLNFKKVWGHVWDDAQESPPLSRQYTTDMCIALVAVWIMEPAQLCTVIRNVANTGQMIWYLQSCRMYHSNGGYDHFCEDRLVRDIGKTNSSVVVLMKQLQVMKHHFWAQETN